MRDHYGPRFDSVHLVQYEHWGNDGPAIDFDVELVKLRERTVPLFGEVEQVVIAKSAGTLLTFVATAEGVLAPTRAIFFGIPFDLAAEGIFKDDWSAVSDFSAPVLAFHNLQDPTTDYRFTAAALAQYLPQAKLITTEGEDHWYGDTEVYDPYLKEFIN